MTDTYKGLTIQIGGDTTKLAQSLKAVDTAAKETQRQLRLLEKAAKLDGSGAYALSERLDAMSADAMALTRRLRTMREAVVQIGSKNGVALLAADTKEAAYQAEKARERYASIVAEIKQFKNQIAKAAGYDLKVEDPFANIANGSEAAIAKMRELGASEEQVAQYSKMVVEYFDAMEKNNLARTVRQFQDLKVNVKATEAELRSMTARMVELAAYNPTATQSAQFQKLAARMKEAESVASGLKTRLSVLDEAINLDPKNINVLVERMRTLSEQANVARERVKTLEAQMKVLGASGADKTAAQVENLGTALNEAKNRVIKLETEMAKLQTRDWFDPASGQAKKLASQLAKATAEMNELAAAAKFKELEAEFAAATARLNAFEAELTPCTSKLSAFAAKMQSLRAVMQNLGWSMYSTLTPALTLFATFAIDAADEVDSAYRDMRKTVQGTESQFEGLKNAAIEYSRTHVTTAETILEIEALGGQLGVATSKLESFATVVSNLDIATDLDAETAATQLGQLSGILEDMTDDDFARYGDALTRLGNNNATLESKISDVMLRISSMGTITGFTTPQLLAWSTAVAATGQGAEAAGTAISKTMSDIESAVGKGGEKLQGFATAAGMSAEEFASAWNNDPSGAMQQFILGLKGIEESGGSADSTLVSLGITSVRQKQSILGLMQTIDGLNDNLTMSQDAWDGVSDEWGDAGDAAREAERKAEGFSGAIQLLKNNFEAFSIEAGDSVRPAIEELASIIEVLTGAYKQLPAPVKQALSALVLVLASLGPLAVAASSVTNAVIEMKKAFLESKAIKKAQEAFTGINESMKAAETSTKANTAATKELSTAQKLAAVSGNLLKASLSALGPVALIAGITALASAFMSLKEHMDDVDGATNGMRSALAEVKAGAKSTGDSWRQATESIIASSNEAIASSAELADSLNETWSEVNSNAGLVDAYKEVIERLGDKSNLTASEQVELQNAIDGMNTVCGTSIKLSASLADENGGLAYKLSESTDEILKQADAWKQNAESQALQESYQETYKRQVELKQQLAKVDEELSNSEQELNSQYDDGTSVVTAAAMSRMQLQQKEGELTAAIEAEQEALDYFSQQQQEANEATEQAAEVSQEQTDQMAQLAEAVGLTSDELSELSENLETAMESDTALKSVIEGSGVAVEAFAAAMSAAGVDVEGLQSKISSYADTAHDAFNRIEQASDLSTDEMLANLQANAEATQSWASNVQALYQRAGDEGTRSFVQSIAEMGPQYATQVAALLSLTDEELAQFGAAWESGSSAAAQAALAELGILPEGSYTEAVAAGQSVSDGYSAGMESGSGSVSASASALALLTSDELGNNDQTGNGQNASDTYAEGIASELGTVSNAAKTVVLGGEEEMDAAKATAWNKGAAVGSNYAVGIWNKMDESYRAGDDVASMAIDALSKYSDYAWQWGAHMGSNFAAGLWSKTTEAADAANAVAEAAAASLEHTIPKEGVLRNGGKGEKPWGQHMVDNYIEGIKSRIPALKQAMREVTDAAAGYMQGYASPQVAGVGGGFQVSAPSVTVNVKVPEQKAVSSGITQNFNTKVVRSDADLYSAATIINNSALRAAGA